MLYIKHMIRTQIYLTEDLYQEVNLVAKKEKKATAQTIRELLETGIKSKKVDSGRGLTQLAQIKAKGPKDLSNKIDKYLYD